MDKKSLLLIINSILCWTALLAFADDSLLNEYRHASINSSKDTSFVNSFNEIQDKQLKDLIKGMILSNSDLKAMTATIERLHSEYEIQRSALYPSVGLVGSSGITRNYGIDDSDNHGDHFVSVPVSYEIDVWKRIKSRGEAVRLLGKAAKYDREALLVTLLSELLQRYYTGLYLYNRIAMLDQVISLTKQISELMQHKFDYGMVSKNEIFLSQQDTKRFSAEQAGLKRELSRVEHALKIITGEYPQDGWLKGEFKIPFWLKNIPAGLPSELVNKRPDLRSFQLRIDSLNYRIDAAKHDSFPSFYLTGNTQASSSELKELTTGDRLSWGVFAQVNLPIFDGYSNKAKYKAELSAKKEISEQYNQVVLNAFGEVENALSGGFNQADLVKSLSERNDLMQQEFSLVKNQFKAGMHDRLKVHSQQQNIILADIDLKDAQLELISYRIQLIRSLGSGWWTDKHLASVYGTLDRLEKK